MSSLSDFEMVETSVHHLKDKHDELMYVKGDDGKPDLTKPMTVELYGPGSTVHSKASHKRSKQILKHYNSKGELKMTDDEARKYQAEFVAAITKSMTNVPNETGKVGEDFFLSVYSNLKLKYIVDQCEAYGKETSNF